MYGPSSKVKATVFFTVEEWESQAHLDAHMKAPALAEAVGTIGEHLAKAPEIHLRLYAEGAASRIGAALDAAEAAIRERLGIRVFGLDRDTMPSVVGGLLVRRGWKIAVAESCTGGLLGSLLTETPGSSAWFDRGFVTYS